MKHADEIKKGLECCIGDDEDICCDGCAYCGEINCVRKMTDDTLALIRQLESKLNQAVEDIRMLGRMGEFICPVCAHYNHGAGDPKHCPKALKEDCFEWRGVQNG